MSESKDPLDQSSLSLLSDVEVSTAAAARPQGPRQKLATSTRALFNLTKCFVGAASLELPKAIEQGGLFAGPLGIVVLAIMSNYTLKQLALCGHLTRRKFPTYPDIGREAFGTVGAVAAWFGVLTMTVGVCGSYFVFIGTSASCLLRQYDERLTAGMCILLLAIPITILSWFRSLKYLAPASFLGILALLFALGASFYDAADNNSIASLSTYQKLNQNEFKSFLGNAAFLYLIHSTILPIEQGMKNQADYPKTINASVLFVTILNLAYCIPVYLLYNNSSIGVQGNVIDNLEHGPIKTAVRILLSLDLLCTCALFLFPVSESLELVLFDPASFGTYKVEVQRNALRMLIIGAITGIAYLIPDFSTLTGLTGGFGNNVVGLLLPPVFYYKLQERRGYWNDGVCGTPEEETPIFLSTNSGTSPQSPSLQQLQVPPSRLSVYLPAKINVEKAFCVLIPCFGLAMMYLTLDSFVQSLKHPSSSQVC